jgi:uncharacterized damage-inducible protein DinB
MKDGRRLSGRITRTFSGPMWHGPALAEVLKDITSADAAARPIGHAHSIWELVLHMTAWAEIVRTRLREMPTEEPTAAEDWPRVTGHSKADWKKAVARMETAYRDLAKDTAKLLDHQLTEKVPGRDHTVEDMLNGIVEHGAYHGGQIVLLKRAIKRR